MSELIRIKPSGKNVRVDHDDYDRLSKYSWWEDPKGYPFRSTRIGGKCKSLRMHREIVGAISGEIVDHINGDKLDNRKTNLRICTASQNQHNRRKRMSGASSRFKGVSWNKKRNGWYAAIWLNGKNKYLGKFTTEVEAAERYDSAAREYFKEFACTNFNLQRVVEGMWK